VENRFSEKVMLKRNILTMIRFNSIGSWSSRSRMKAGHLFGAREANDPPPLTLLSGNPRRSLCQLSRPRKSNDKQIEHDPKKWMPLLRRRSCSVRRRIIRKRRFPEKIMLQEKIADALRKDKIA